jgi:PAS domain S-box-containing protein
MEALENLNSIQQEKLIYALEHSMDGVALLNAKGEYYYLNEEHLTMFGYTKQEELIGKPWQHIYGPSEIDRINQSIFPELIERGRWRGKTIGKSKTGDPVYQEISLTTMSDGGIICIARNIWEDVQKKHQLSNQQYLLDSSNTIFAIFNKQFFLTWGNKELSRVIGIPQKDLHLHRVSEFLDVTHELSDLQDQQELQQESRVTDANGQKRWVKWRITYHQEASSYFLVGNDATADKKQQELQQIIHSISEGFLSQKNKNDYFNKVLAQLLHLTESEYGFLGEVFYEQNKPYLKTYALTNISWDEATKTFYEQHAPQGLEFKNLDTLFGYAMKHRTVVIANNAPQDHRRGGVPSGHPPLNAFLGIPVFTGNNEMVGLIGLANNKQGYTNEDVVLLSPFLEMFGSTIKSYKEEMLRQEAEASLSKTLAERNAFFKALDASSVISITDLNGKIEYVNNIFLEALEYTREEVLGNDFRKIQSGLHDPGFWKEMWETVMKGRTWRAEICNRSKSGNNIWFETAITPIYDDLGEIKQLMSISTVVTRRKQLESDVIRQFNELGKKQSKLVLQDEILKNTSSVVVITDISGKITWVNNAFTYVTGYSAEEAIGKVPGHFLQSEKTDKETIHRFSEAIKEKKEFYAELLNCHKNGREYWIQIKCQPIYNAAGEHIGFFAIEEDITTRKESETKVQEQKLLLDLAIAGADAGIWDWNMMENNISYSAGWEKQMGFGVDTNWMNRIHPEDRQYVMDQLYAHITGVSETYNAEFRIKNSRNEYVYVLDRGRVISFTKIGKPERMIGVSINIHDIKETEEMLRVSEARMHSVLDASGAAIWEWNIPEDRVVAGEEFAQLFGYSSLTSMPMSTGGLIPLVKKEDRKEMFRQFNEHLAGNLDKLDIEYRVKNPTENDYIWYNLKGAVTIRSSSGKPILAIGSCYRIHERKKTEAQLVESEKKLKMLIEASGVALWEWYIVEDRIEAGDDFARLFGYAHFSEMPEKYSELFQRLPESDRQLVNKQMQDHISGKVPSMDNDFRIMQQGTRNYIWVNAKGTIIQWTPEGQPMKAAGFMYNIQDRKEAEEALAKAKDQAEASVRAKRRFLANMSHEIRTPLHAILGISDQLIQTKLREEQKQKVEIINESANALLGIINDVIELSRIEEGKLKIQLTPFYYKHLVKNAFQLFESAAQNKGLTYELDFDPNLNRLVLGDPTRVRQILLNLLSNAVKFTEKGSIKLSCTLKEEKGREPMICLSCADTGIGMSEDMKNRLFTDFSQEDESFQRKYGGSGLGLAITNELIHLMSGTISIESKKNTGTIVTVYLPYQESGTQEIKTAMPEAIDLSVFAGKKILVAEDNKFNRLLVEMIFQKHELSFQMAVNGVEAVDLATTTPFDLILMDIQMPEMDGVEALKRIRRNKKNTRPVILAVTANAIKEELEEYIQLGFDGYITKPFDESQLLEKMSAAMKPPPKKTHK